MPFAKSTWEGYRADSSHVVMPLGMFALFQEEGGWNRSSPHPHELRSCGLSQGERRYIPLSQEDGR